MYLNQRNCPFAKSRPRNASFFPGWCILAHLFKVLLLLNSPPLLFCLSGVRQRSAQHHDGEVLRPAAVHHPGVPAHGDRDQTESLQQVHRWVHRWATWRLKVEQEVLHRWNRKFFMAPSDVYHHWASRWRSTFSLSLSLSLPLFLSLSLFLPLSPSFSFSLFLFLILFSLNMWCYFQALWFINFFTHTHTHSHSSSRSPGLCGGLSHPRKHKPGIWRFLEANVLKIYIWWLNPPQNTGDMYNNLCVCVCVCVCLSVSPFSPPMRRMSHPPRWFIHCITNHWSGCPPWRAVTFHPAKCVCVCVSRGGQSSHRAVPGGEPERGGESRLDAPDHHQPAGLLRTGGFSLMFSVFRPLMKSVKKEK